jgi:hypothetical protein
MKTHHRAWLPAPALLPRIFINPRAAGQIGFVLEDDALRQARNVIR